MKKPATVAQNQTFSYLQHMLTELRIMSEKENATVLAYLIEMAIIEAKDLAEGIHVPRQEVSSRAVEVQYMTGS